MREEPTRVSVPSASSTAREITAATMLDAHRAERTKATNLRGLRPATRMSGLEILKKENAAPS
jgi:hypothetical protein